MIGQTCMSWNAGLCIRNVPDPRCSGHVTSQTSTVPIRIAALVLSSLHHSIVTVSRDEYQAPIDSAGPGMQAALVRPGACRKPSDTGIKVAWVITLANERRRGVYNRAEVGLARLC